MSSGIPTRMIYGSLLKPTLNGIAVDGSYHATGYKGVDKSKVDYYFGNIDERRVVWSTERDLVFEPPQDDGPANSLSKAYLEIDAKPSTDWTREFTYKEVPVKELAL